MNLQEIKEAVNNGRKVYWANTAYEVVHDKYDQWFIVCTLNNSSIYLTYQDGSETLNGKEEEFFIGEE